MRKRRPVALGVGAGLGLLSGLTGTGGGIFLAPLVIFMHWARTASAISAAFILVNSISGLLGNLSATKTFPPFALPLAGAASYLGSSRSPSGGDGCCSVQSGNRRTFTLLKYVLPLLGCACKAKVPSLSLRSRP